jgi:hypothetical protein
MAHRTKLQVTRAGVAKANHAQGWAGSVTSDGTASSGVTVSTGATAATEQHLASQRSGQEPPNCAKAGHWEWMPLAHA